MKKLFVFVIVSLMVVMTAACGGSASGNTGATTGNAVHMNETQFAQPSITIKKGESLTLINDVSMVHIIENGTWDSNGTPKPNIEPGAPKVDMQFQTMENKTIGPFNTSGTYHLYCSVHPGMNLTVIVQ